METRVLSCLAPRAQSDAVDVACAVLERGEVVALPAETVYGLAGDALNPAAAARIFEAKERPFFDPLICHIPNLDWLERLTNVSPGVRPVVEQLASAFWPGPLTLVLPRSNCVPDLVSSGLPSVAVRWSAHPLFQAVLTRFARPLAAPSANRFGRISPTAADHVVQELSGRIPLVLDGGPCLHGVESTIVAPSERGLRILRSGPVTAAQLEAFAPVLANVGVETSDSAAEAPEAPGQLKSHYAPSTRLHLLEPGQRVETGARWGLLAWREPRSGFAQVEVMSASGDLREAASRLFAAMRRLDAGGHEVLFAELVPETGLGVAINDRLRRAAAR